MGPSELRTFVGTGETVRDGVNMLPCSCLEANLSFQITSFPFTPASTGPSRVGQATRLAMLQPPRGDPLQGRGVEASAG